MIARVHIIRLHVKDLAGCRYKDFLAGDPALEAEDNSMEEFYEKARGLNSVHRAWLEHIFEDVEVEEETGVEPKVREEVACITG